MSGWGSKTNIRTRDAPSIITRVLGALCQEPGAETNTYIFYYLTMANPVFSLTLPLCYYETNIKHCVILPINISV